MDEQATSAFRPRMQVRREGIEVIEGWARPWEGGGVEVWRADCAAGANGDYISRDPRLFVVLEPLAAALAFWADGRPVAASTACSVSFIPAGAPLSSRLAGATPIRHLDLHVVAERVPDLIGGESALTTPRLMVADDRALALARLLAAECASAAPLPPLYGDSLTTALLCAALGVPAATGRRRSRLSERKLRRAVDYIEDHCLRAIRLQELADLTGLTPSSFSHAFKAATGMPPHRWQMTARLRKAQDLLANTDAPLTEIAVATGFADQPHFTRVFRKLMGRTPAAWRNASG